MKHILNIIIITISILGVFYSCDFYEFYLYQVDNKTNHTIEIYLTGNSSGFHRGVDTIICYPDTVNIFSHFMGISTKYGCFTGLNDDDITIIISNGTVLKKDITDANNWECTGSFRYGWNLIFTITENDLE